MPARRPLDLQDRLQATKLTDASGAKSTETDRASAAEAGNAGGGCREMAGGKSLHPEIDTCYRETVNRDYWETQSSGCRLMVEPQLPNRSR